jgi:hypothetical protein
MTATATQQPAAIVPPKKAGECLTWKQLNDIPKETHLAIDKQGGYDFQVYISIKYVSGGLSIKGLSQPSFTGKHSVQTIWKSENAEMSSKSPFRLATQREIKKANKDYVKAWRQAYYEASKELAEALEKLQKAEREAGLDIPPPPREPTE